MQIKLGIFANVHQWLVAAAVVFSHVACATGIDPIEFQLPADEFKQGCAVLFEAASTATDEDRLGTPPLEINVTWKCNGLPSQLLDTYGIEGGSPKIVTSFIRNRSQLVVAAKWHICSPASDFCGDLYRIFLYQYMESSESDGFIKIDSLKDKELTGMEGIKNGRKVSFPLRSKEAINAALDQLER